MVFQVQVPSAGRPLASTSSATAPARSIAPSQGFRLRSRQGRPEPLQSALPTAGHAHSAGGSLLGSAVGVLLGSPFVCQPLFLLRRSWVLKTLQLGTSSPFQCSEPSRFLWFSLFVIYFILSYFYLNFLAFCLDFPSNFMLPFQVHIVLLCLRAF